MKPDVHMRSWPLVCAFVALLSAVNARAQKPVEHDLKIIFNGSITLPQTKFVHEGLRAQDPDAFVWVDVGARYALVRVHAPLDRGALQQVLQPCGLSIVRITEVGADMLRSQNAEAEDDEASPQYVDTGNEAMDDMRYDIAKRAWAQEHPDAYQRITAPESEQ